MGSFYQDSNVVEKCVVMSRLLEIAVDIPPNLHRKYKTHTKVRWSKDQHEDEEE